MTDPRQKFISAINANQAAFELELPFGAIEKLADYYELVLEHNPLLHLVGPCSPDDFAVRHILESLALLPSLPKNMKLADVGPGAGLPSIPCLIVRIDLSAVLIESKEKKARFLESAIERLGLVDRAVVINKQFEEVTEKDFGAVTCRALDKFTEKLPRLVKWAGNRRLLFYGGPSIDSGLRSAKVPFTSLLLPLSTQRFLFVSKRRV